MVCVSCNGEGNAGACNVCYPIPRTVQVINDVIYYIYYHSSRATYERIAVGCERSFFEPLIIEAKKALLDVVLDDLSEINKSLAVDVVKERRGVAKTKAAIADIYKVLKALGTTVVVEPVNADNISLMNPEFLCSESLVTRVIESETKLKETEEKVQQHNVQIESLLGINKALRCLLNEILNEAGFHATGVGKLQEALSAVDAAVAAAPASAVDALTAAAADTAASTVRPTRATQSSDDLGLPDSVAVAATLVDASERDDTPPVSVDLDAGTPVSADIDAGNAQPNEDDESNDTPVDHAATGDSSQVPPAGVSDAVVPNVAPLSPLPEASASVDPVTQEIVRVKPKPLPRSSKTNASHSLKHQRNIKAQHMAAATAALAVENGFPSDVATKMGTMAADCVAKNFSNNSNSKTYSDTIKNGIGNSGNVVGSLSKGKAPTKNAASANTPQKTSPTDTTQRNKKHRYNSSCITGTGTIATNGSSLAYVKPQIPQNKVLVVAGLNKAVNSVKLQSEVNKKAGCHVNLIHVQGLSRTINRSRTIAIELDNAGYELLSQSDFWEPNIRIWPFKGRHFWYYPKPHTKQEARNSVRESWT